LAEANRDKDVAVESLAAAKDQAAAIVAQKQAEAAVIEFQNQAEAAGWKSSVEAFGGDGSAFARYVMFQKLAPGFRSIMANTGDSPLMNMFKNITEKKEQPKQ
jgi:regulator of protease activity HflC (stomatin/prohibitin superfamily)